jgi:hypothetical protein
MFVFRYVLISVKILFKFPSFSFGFIANNFQFSLSFIKLFSLSSIRTLFWVDWKFIFNALAIATLVAIYGDY